MWLLYMFYTFFSLLFVYGSGAFFATTMLFPYRWVLSIIVFSLERVLLQLNNQIDNVILLSPEKCFIFCRDYATLSSP